MVVFLPNWMTWKPTKKAAGTLPPKILVHVRACHCRSAARWMFMACPYFTNTIVNKMAKPNAKPSKYGPGLLKHMLPKLFEWLQSSLEKDMEKLIIASLMCRTCTVQFWCALLMSSREKGMWLRDLQLDVAPQEMLTASKRCVSHRNFNVPVGARGTVTASAAECLLHCLWKSFVRILVMNKNMV